MNDSFTHDRSVARQGKDVMFAVGIDEARRHCSTSVFLIPSVRLNVDSSRLVSANCGLCARARRMGQIDPRRTVVDGAKGSDPTKLGASPRSLS
jgi:hypothetical protein